MKLRNCNLDLSVDSALVVYTDGLQGRWLSEVGQNIGILSLYAEIINVAERCSLGSLENNVT